MVKSKRGQSDDGAVVQVKQALEKRAIEIGGHVRNINDAAAAVLHILRTDLITPGSSARPRAVEQWDRIEAKVRETVLGIRKLSTKNEARINDALGSFRTYLSSKDDPAHKLEELEIYKRELSELGDQTAERLRIAFDALKSVLKDIEAFKRHWPRGDSTDYAKRIKPSLDEIAGAIQSILKEEEDMRDHNFFPNQIAAVLTPITFLLPSMEQRALRSLIDGHVHARVEVIVEVDGNEFRQARQFNPLYCLVDVGHLLRADMEDIQAQYEISYDQNDFEGFRRRFGGVLSIYSCLGGALRAFGKACHEQVKHSTPSGACGGKTTTGMARDWSDCPQETGDAEPRMKVKKRGGMKGKIFFWRRIS